MAYLIKASQRFGASWEVSDPCADRIATLAERTGKDARALADGILAIETIFDSELAANVEFRRSVAEGLEGLLSDNPMQFVGRICERRSVG